MRIGQSFLHLIDVHFPKNYTFNKIFNKNKIKVSYSCMQNIKAVINNHNMNIFHQNNEIKDECNCRNRRYCPLGGKFLSPNAVYQRKDNFNSTQLQWQSLLFWVAEKLPMMKMKITQVTHNYWKNTGKLKGTTLFQR